MKLINDGKRYHSGDLKRLAMAVAKGELEPAQRKNSIVIVRNSRRHLSGRAIVRGRTSWLYLPPNAHELPRWQLAMVLAHEFAHNRGMTGERRMRSPESKYGWSEVAARPILFA